VTAGRGAALGVLTIGQSPRDDIVPTLRKYCPPGTAITELGLLDHMSAEQIAQLQPCHEADAIETRLRDGNAVIVSKTALEPLLAAALAEMPRPVLLLCSSTFAVLESIAGVIRPNELILPIMRHVAAGHRLGVIGPESDLPRQPGYWHPHVPDAIFAAGSPTDPIDALETAGMRLVGDGATLLFLDCMGFRDDQREALRQAAGVPVVAATTLVARLLPEIL